MAPQKYNLTGQSLIAGEAVSGTGGTFASWDPAMNELLDPSYSLLRPGELIEATRAADEAFDQFRSLSPTERGEFLEQIAKNIEGVSDQIVDRAMAETGLSEVRLRGELQRTTSQLRLFASVVRDGNHHGARIDPAIPDREPLPRADIRQRKIPLGPVAVFGSSNFPLAFSTAGGDTASALAAGCPVVFKAHNAHPGTGELVGRAISAAVETKGLPPGTFSLVYGPGTSIGQALVADPVISAVAFTGSRSGGTALMRIAAERPVPVPVFAEMSSINPVYVFPGAARNDVEALAEAYVTSAVGSSGQLCTQPGIVFVPKTKAGADFSRAISEAVAIRKGQTMLTPGIYESWVSGVNTLLNQDEVRVLGQGTEGSGEHAPAPVILEVDSAIFRSNPTLREEVFGAISLVVHYDSIDDLIGITAELEGQLTATLHLSSEDFEPAKRLLPVLERMAGRLLVNDWPTGVEVGHAMVHGGPYPATSDSRTTSVGSRAIERFLRPVAYQNLPEELTPEPIRDSNPWKLPRLVDGTMLQG